jgi:hypothetical protein
MADLIRTRAAAAQDTGNPVLDSLVNIMSSGTLLLNVDEYPILHDMLLQLAAKEPGGLKTRGRDGILYPVDSSAVPAPKGRQTAQQLADAARARG